MRGGGVVQHVWITRKFPLLPQFSLCPLALLCLRTVCTALTSEAGTKNIKHFKEGQLAAKHNKLSAEHNKLSAVERKERCLEDALKAPSYDEHRWNKSFTALQTR